MVRVALVVLVALIGGLLAGATPAGAARQPDVGAPALAWKPCADRAQRGFECATPSRYAPQGMRKRQQLRHMS